MYLCYFSNVVAIVHKELWWLKTAKKTLLEFNLGIQWVNLGTFVVSYSPAPPPLVNHWLLIVDTTISCDKNYQFYLNLFVKTQVLAAAAFPGALA